MPDRAVMPDAKKSRRRTAAMKSSGKHVHDSVFQDNDDQAAIAGQVPPEDLMEDLRNHHAAQPTFLQTNLISDGFVAAQKTDANLINPWGVSYSPTSPFWISDNGTGLASVDSLSGGTVTLNVIPAVTIPGASAGDTSAPTGQVFNAFQSTGAFMLPDGSPATFLFATEDGTIAGWNRAAGTTAIITVNDSQDTAHGDLTLGGAVYK